MRNQTNKIGFILTVLCLSILFVVFVLLGDGQTVRSSRACFPISWAGNLTASSVSLFDRNEAHTLINDGFRPVFSSCVKSASELFYGESVKEHFRHLPERLISKVRMG